MRAGSIVRSRPILDGGSRTRGSSERDTSSPSPAAWLRRRTRAHFAVAVARSAGALFIPRAEHPVAAVPARISWRKSRILPMDRGWMRTGGGGGARPRERCGAAKFHPPPAADRQPGRQTRAMDEMLTRRETIDYSRQDRSRQVEREMVFLYQSGPRDAALPRPLIGNTREAFIPRH